MRTSKIKNEIDQLLSKDVSFSPSNPEKGMGKEVASAEGQTPKASHCFMSPQAADEKTQDAFGNALAALKPTKPIAPAYCDYIAHRIHDALSNTDFERLIGCVGRVYGDLHPDGGYLLSTKKTIKVTDVNGTKYRVTVEEIEP